jgi:rhodanese-related sulfurtransferase
LLDMVRQVGPVEVQRQIESGHPPMLLDVREAEELLLARLPGAVHIPMGEVPGRLHELDPEAEIVVFCHHGIRSANAAQFLAQRDFAHVANLSGGIDAWSVTVDPTVPRY